MIKNVDEDDLAEKALEALRKVHYEVRVQAYKDQTPFPIWRNNQVEYELPEEMPQPEDFIPK